MYALRRSLSLFPEKAISVFSNEIMAVYYAANISVKATGKPFFWVKIEATIDLYREMI